MTAPSLTNAAAAETRTVPSSHPKDGTRNRPVPRFQEPTGTTGNRPEVFESLGDFLTRAENEPPRTWLLPRIVPDRGRVMIVASPNAGKTWLALATAKAACALNREVFLVEEEGSLRGLADRLKALAFPVDAQLRIAHLKALHLDDRGQRDQLSRLVAGSEAPVMILDPMTSLWRGDENDTKSANMLREQLDVLAKANPAALLLVLHHTSKASSNGEGSDVYAGRGSTVFGGWADLQLNLRHESVPSGAGYVDLGVLVAKDREGERGYRAKVRIEFGSGQLSIDDAPAGGTVAMEARVLTVLRKAPDGLTKNAICEDVTGKRATKLECIDQLVERGTLVLEGGRIRLAPLTEDGS